MKRFIKTMAVTGLLVFMAVPSFAASADRPVEIYAELTGQTVVEAWEEMREAEMTFGELAEENGVGDEFQSLIKDAHKARLDELVEEGRLTQEEADEILENIETCDGTPGSHAGTHGLYYGGGFGNRDGSGQGFGHGRGHGHGNGGGFGNGNRWNEDDE